MNWGVLSMEMYVEQKCRNARGLPSDALGQLRRQVVAAVESGASQIQVAFMFGVSRRSVGEWVRAYRVRGEESFRPAQRGRRPGEQCALSSAQQEQILRIIVAGPPDRSVLPWRLWTRRVVAELIHQEIGIRLMPVTVGRYLQRWGLDADAGTRTRPYATIEPAIPRVGGLAPVPVEDVRLAWTRPRLLLGREPAHALLAVTSRGVLHFLAGDRPFDIEALDDLRHRLRMQLARDVRMVVCTWPPEHLELLHSWLSGGIDAVPRGARV